MCVFQQNYLCNIKSIKINHNRKFLHTSHNLVCQNFAFIIIFIIISHLCNSWFDLYHLSFNYLSFLLRFYILLYFLRIILLALAMLAVV